MGYINCISPSLSPSVLDQSLCLREHLLLALLLILVKLLLATHAVNHIKHIDRGNINLLLLGLIGFLLCHFFGGAAFVLVFI